MKYLNVASVWLLTPILLGQMCGAPGPITQDLGGGLQGGLYSGDIYSSGSLTISSPSGTNVDPLSETRTSNLTVTTNGLPATTAGREMAIGVVDSAQVGIMSISYTVTGLTIGDGSVLVASNVLMTFTLPDQTIITMTGVATDYYRQLDTQIAVSSEAIASGTYLDAVVTLTLRSSGTLTR